MSYLLLAIYLALLIWLINHLSFFNKLNYPKYIPALIFISKFIGGIIVYLVYAHFYGSRVSGDIFKYFDDGNVIYSSLHQNPVDYIKMITGIGGDAPYLQKYYDTCRFWNKEFNYGLINDNRIVIRFNAIVRLISMGNMHIHTLFMSFISFTGLWAILRVFYEYLSKQKWLLLLVIFFFPSVYFWTSGVLKEGLLTFAFGVFIYNYVSILKHKKKIKNLIMLGVTVFILLLSKFYVLIAALPGLLFLFIIETIGKKYFFTKLLLSIVTFLVLSFISKPIVGISFPEVVERKQHDFIAYTNSLNEVGSKISIPDLDPTFKSIALNSPQAFFRTLFRPHIFEISNLMSLMAVMENLIILVLMALSVTALSLKNTKNELFWFCTLFVLILFTLSGLTTPVLGALVRYKAPALPFLGMMFLFIINFDKLKSYTKFFGKNDNALQ